LTAAFAFGGDSRPRISRERPKIHAGLPTFQAISLLAIVPKCNALALTVVNFLLLYARVWVVGVLEWKMAMLGANSAVFPIGPAARRKNMNKETNIIIADLDVELTAIGGYDSVSGMPCGSLVGPIHPYIRPEGSGVVESLVTAAE
jgi:hypothetical protein